jgi:hypothetical protein
MVMGDGGVTDQRISSLTSGGFTVTNDGPFGAGAGFNVSGRKYAAIVWKDSSSNGRHLKTGSYVGAGDRAVQVTATNGKTDITYANGTFSIADEGRYLFIAPNTYLFHYVNQTSGVIDPFFSGSTGLNNGTLLGSSQQFTALGLEAVSHVWIWGRATAYKSLADFGSGDSSIQLQREGGGNVVVDVIKAMSGNTFTRGNYSTINSPGLFYYWYALDTSKGIAGGNFFKSFKITGAAADPDIVTGLGFQVELAEAERYLTGGLVGAQGAWWKTANTGTQSGATSHRESDGVSGSTSITAVGNGTVDINDSIASNGDDVYGYAFALSGTVDATDVPIVGTGGVSVSGGANANYSAGSGGGTSGGGGVAISAVAAGGAPEIHGNQWGLHRFDIRPRPEETA